MGRKLWQCHCGLVTRGNFHKEERESVTGIVMLNIAEGMDSNDGERIDFEDVKKVDTIF